MGKGDKKTRRGKIILGTYGVRRRHLKGPKVSARPLEVKKEKEKAGKKPVKEKAEIKTATEVKEKVVKEKSAPKAQKVPKEKKEVIEAEPETKPKKEKKS